MQAKIKLKLKKQVIPESKENLEHKDLCHLCSKNTTQDCSKCYKMTCDNCIGYCTSDYEFECKTCWFNAKNDLVLLDELSILNCQKCSRNIVPNNFSLGIRLNCDNCDDDDDDDDDEDNNNCDSSGFYSLCNKCNGDKKIKIKCDNCNKLLSYNK